MTCPPDFQLRLMNANKDYNNMTWTELITALDQFKIVKDLEENKSSKRQQKQQNGNRNKRARFNDYNESKCTHQKQPKGRPQNQSRRIQNPCRMEGPR